MVTEQAPRPFAIVMEREDPADAQIAAWGMALEDSAYMKDSAYMISVDGRNQYCLAEPENARMYVRSSPGRTPHFIWA